MGRDRQGRPSRQWTGLASVAGGGLHKQADQLNFRADSSQEGESFWDTQEDSFQLNSYFLQERIGTCGYFAEGALSNV